MAEISPVYFPLARAAKRCGFVVFEPDVDGVMRRMRLFVQYDGRVLPQLACAVGLDELGWQPAGVERKRFPQPAVFRRWAAPAFVQVDADGRVLVPWLPQRNWTQQFGPHVPIDALWQIYDRRLSVQHNDELVADVLGQLLAAGDLVGASAVCRRSEAAFAAAVRIAAGALSRRCGRRAAERDMAGGVSERCGRRARCGLRGVAGRSGPRCGFARDVRDAGVQKYLDALRTLEQAFAANDGYHAEIEATLGRLRPRIEGRLCMVGYTATSLADMTPIPTHHRAPGVMAHANLLNGLLTGRTVSLGARVAERRCCAACLVGTLAALASVPSRAAPAVLVGCCSRGRVALGAGGWRSTCWTYWMARDAGDRGSVGGELRRGAALPLLVPRTRVAAIAHGAEPVHLGDAGPQDGRGRRAVPPGRDARGHRDVHRPGELHVDFRADRGRTDAARAQRFAGPVQRRDAAPRGDDQQVHRRRHLRVLEPGDLPAAGPRPAGVRDGGRSADGAAAS